MRKPKDHMGLEIVIIFVACMASLSLDIYIAAKQTRKEPMPIQSSSEEMSELNLSDEDVATTEHCEFTYEWEQDFFDQVSAQVDVEPRKKYIGKFRLTVYTPYEDSYGYHTATGEISQHLMTCAVDPKVIPYGSIIVIGGENGLRLKAIDCGEGVKGHHIDIFYDGSEASGIEWLMENYGDFATVYLEGGTEECILGK